MSINDDPRRPTTGGRPLTPEAPLGTDPRLSSDPVGRSGARLAPGDRAPVGRGLDGAPEPTSTQVRQASWGRPVLMVLGAGLVLGAIYIVSMMVWQQRELNPADGPGAAPSAMAPGTNSPATGAPGSNAASNPATATPGARSDQPAAGGTTDVPGPASGQSAPGNPAGGTATPGAAGTGTTGTGSGSTGTPAR